MQILNELNKYGHEQIVFGHDEKTGLQVIIAIHSTVLGPAVGGTRIWNYETEDDALFDVLRLSRGMTFKNAAAGLKLGGGKAVILGDAKKLKSREFFHAYARIVDSLGGKYYTAEDVNIGTSDVAQINEVTKFVTGTPAVSGNPAPFTARGVYMGMKAGAGIKFGTDSLEGKVVAVQGVGSVGYALCELIHKEGGKLKVFDINPDSVEKASKEFGAIPVPAKEILTTNCDIFAPCALGAVINTDNAKELKCRLIAGSANNVLMDAATGDELESLNILYLPDYIINAGGIINCSIEVTDPVYDINVVNTKVDKIYNTTKKIVALAKQKQISTYQAADEYAQGIIDLEKSGKNIA